MLLFFILRVSSRTFLHFSDAPYCSSCCHIHFELLSLSQDPLDGGGRGEGRREREKANIVSPNIPSSTFSRPLRTLRRRRRRQASKDNASTEENVCALRRKSTRFFLFSETSVSVKTVSRIIFHREIFFCLRRRGPKACGRTPPLPLLEKEGEGDMGMGGEREGR